MHGSSIIAAIMPALGAASVGAVVALIVADRIVRARPVETRTRLVSAAWALALVVGVTAQAAWLAGPGVLPWLAAGMAMGGSTRLTVLKAWHRLP
ncbi:hypothetical protein [Bradyrhizobium sp. WSM1743]|uniref:hypothetical protein n=1 Tax=Bradyrhizobium sp. WSM1743 TaxID=318996 RepID=UPI000419920C|nr:hypothetical protein [Bradyrhizobium sp. WSM1743]